VLSAREHEFAVFGVEATVDGPHPVVADLEPDIGPLIGLDNIAWECDYPHSDSSWPTAPEVLEAGAVGVPDHELNKITFENAARWYQFDPFAHRPRERCTVGALRERPPVMTCLYARTTTVGLSAPPASS
jgi:hypothetical protein